MKNLIPVLFTLLLLSACQKEPSTSDLESEFVVFTNYDKETSFSDFETFYVPDSVLLINDQKVATYWSGENSDEIINTFVDEMETKGYTRVADKEMADLGLQVSYIENTYYLASYTDPYWWGGYPGYWAPGYWGGWGGWYYPYYIYYNYNVGSMLAEFVNLDAPEDSEKKLPVVWNCYMTGLLSGNNKFDLNLTIRAIEQGFAQSPYIKM